MKKNHIGLYAIIVASLCLGKSASAVLPIPVYSGIFNFTTGQLGSVGSAEGWANANASVTVTNGSGSLDGTALGLVASTGDKVYIATNATSGVASDNVFANKGTFPQTTNVDIYISFLYKFDSAPAAGSSVKICQENLQNSGSTVYWDLQLTNDSGQIQLGVEKNGAGAVFATTNINVGQTYFVVVRHQILPGTTDDIIDLWINPPPASFGADEASLPPTSATTSTGTEPNSTTGPGRFYLDIGAFGAEFDELRIATNWAVVTPAFGSCVSAGIYQSPLSQTNVAEIADFFTVIPSPTSTSPTYQWQISGASSSDWTNISGAISASYTTPNLALATDNGNKYRCIVTVPCDGSSATSGVATVTLTAPAVTPVGLVMDDTFTAGIAEPITPVTISNASWYTDLATHSSAFNLFPGQYLQATPASGSSTLWLAYVTPTNNPPTNNLPNLPVHLAVGNTIKATCQFTPVSFNYFTNNASFRIGLFDYADGGTRIVTPNSTCGGSAGNGVNVRGYMLSVDFGTNFSTSSPLSMYSRVGLSDINLMGTTGDYLGLGGGPAGGGYSGAQAFQAGVNYTLVLSVTRNDVNSVIITNSITGGGTNWTFTLTETNQAYHRFDAFAMRPNSLETSADSFDISELKIEVVAGPSAPANINITSVSRIGNNVTLAWNPNPAGTYAYSVLHKLNLTDASWTTLATGISTTSFTDTNATGNTGFYLISSP